MITSGTLSQSGLGITADTAYYVAYDFTREFGAISGIAVGGHYDFRQQASTKRVRTTIWVGEVPSDLFEIVIDTSQSYFQGTVDNVMLTPNTNIPTLGTDLVSNGNFNGGSTDWNLDEGSWSTLEGEAWSSATIGYLSQQFVFENPGIYEVTFRAKSEPIGDLEVVVGDYRQVLTQPVLVSLTTDYAEYTIRTQRQGYIDGETYWEEWLTLRNVDGTDITMSNIEANLVTYDPLPCFCPELVVNGTFDTDTDWTKQSSWTISEGVATSDGASGYSTLGQGDGVFVSGDFYDWEFTVTNYVSGDLQLTLGNNYAISVSANGTYAGTTEAQELLPNGEITFASLSFIGSIDNVSVQPVGCNPPNTSS